ncbi:MAG: Rne/Rng family ribonuclease [Planctomycetota bacterium]|jgi:ribonuclease E
MAKEMLINVEEGEESRVAIVDKGVLDEFYIERASLVSHVGNIYKGRITNVEPSIQAAFVDFGLGKNGFLHISDVHPRYLKGKDDSAGKIGRRKALKERPPIQKCLKRGREIVVQVTKEGINTKGPTLSTYVSMPGKYVVLMPWMHRTGVSQKIEDEDERKRLRKIISQFEIPKGAGLIIRTAAQGATKRELQNDVAYLNRLWTAIRKRMEATPAPATIYQESDLVIRTIRDIFTSKVSKIICDNEAITKRIRDFLGIVQPRLRKRATTYEGKMPLFHKYGIEKEISKIQSSRVELKNGSYLIIEQTEALVAIDVNSGKYRRQDSAEKTAHKTNIEAAKEIVRQLKLRDMGGLIICDFIDMRDARHRKDVEKTFRDELKNDRARSRVLRMSMFGLIELTRQRMRPSLQSSTYLKCPHCGGSGIIKSLESHSIEIMRLLFLAGARGDIRRIELSVSPEVEKFLQNQKRAIICELEADSNKQVIINVDPNCAGGSYNMACYDERGSLLKF